MLEEGATPRPWLRSWKSALAPPAPAVKGLLLNVGTGLDPDGFTEEDS